MKYARALQQENWKESFYSTSNEYESSILIDPIIHNRNTISNFVQYISVLWTFLVLHFFQIPNQFRWSLAQSVLIPYETPPIIPSRTSPPSSLLPPTIVAAGRPSPRSLS
jgi:hypothetical protein